MNNGNKSKLEEKFIHNIAQLTGLTISQVKDVFYYYRLLVLHEIAEKPSPKNEIEISLPCFCSLRIKPKGNNVMVTIPRFSKDKYVSPLIREAYFNNKNFLLEDLLTQFSKELEKDALEKMENNDEWW